MRPQTIESRVERLEKRMAMLEELPARIDRVETQIVQLRDEMHDECSAVRQEMRHLGSGLGVEIRATSERTVGTLRDEIRATSERTVGTLRDEIRATNERTVAILREENQMMGHEIRTSTGQLITSLREDMLAMQDKLTGAIEAARRETRVLFEEAVARIATLNEAREGRRRSPKPSKG